MAGDTTAVTSGSPLEAGHSACLVNILLGCQSVDFQKLNSAGNAIAAL